MDLVVDRPPVAPALADPSARALWLWWCTALLLTGVGVALHFSPLDRTLFYAANGWQVLPPLFWSCVTVAGLGLSAAIVAPALDRGHGRVVATLVYCFPIGTLFTHGGKWLVGSGRPGAVLPHDTVVFIGHPLTGHNSMPSGHALTAFAACTLLWLTHPLARRWLLGLLTVAALVAWSRLATAAHWPADVLAGSGLGIAAAMLAFRLARGGGLQRRIATPAGQLLLACVELALCVAMLMQRTGYPLGAPMQLLLAALALASALWRLASVRRRMRAPRAAHHAQADGGPHAPGAGRPAASAEPR